MAEHETQARILVGGFLHHRRDLVVRAPEGHAEAARAFPTPRTWEKTARLLAYAQAAGVGDSVVRVLLTGTIGQAATIEFLQWQRALDLPDPEHILRAPDAFLAPSRPDLVHPIASSLLAALRDKPTSARATAMEKALVTLADAGHIDAVYSAATGLARLRVKGWQPEPPFVVAFAQLVGALGDLRAA